MKDKPKGAELALQGYEKLGRFDGHDDRLEHQFQPVFKTVDLVDFLYHLLLLADASYIEFQHNRRFIVEHLFDDVELMKMEAAFYADPHRAHLMDRFFKLYCGEGEAERFWQQIERFAKLFPNPYERVKTLLFLMISGGDLFTLGER